MEDDIDNDYDSDIHIELLPSKQPQDDTPAPILPASEELVQVLATTSKDVRYLYSRGINFEWLTKFNDFEVIINERYTFKSNVNVKDNIPKNRDVYKEFKKMAKHLGGYPLTCEVPKEQVQDSGLYRQMLSCDIIGQQLQVLSMELCGKK